MRLQDAATQRLETVAAEVGWRIWTPFEGELVELDLEVEFEMESPQMLPDRSKLGSLLLSMQECFYNSNEHQIHKGGNDRASDYTLKYYTHHN